MAGSRRRSPPAAPASCGPLKKRRSPLYVYSLAASPSLKGEPPMGMNQRKYSRQYWKVCQVLTKPIEKSAKQQWSREAAKPLGVASST